MGVLSRLVQAVLLLLALSWILMAVMHALPGQGLENLDDPHLDSDRYRELRGLNLPPSVRFRCWWVGSAADGCERWPGKGLLNGDLGFAWVYQRPLGQVLPRRLAVSLALGVPVLVLAFLAAMLLGLAAAIGPAKRWTEATLLLAGSMPLHWLSLMVLWGVAVQLQWAPVAPPASSPLGLRLALPIGVFSLYLGLRWARFVRSRALEVLCSEYVMAAQARGVGPLRLWRGHVLPAATVPLLAMGVQTLPMVVSGTVILETVFSVPGMGRLIYDSIRADDALTSVTVFMLYAALTVVATQLGDLMLKGIDPRVRFGRNG